MIKNERQRQVAVTKHQEAMALLVDLPEEEQWSVRRFADDLAQEIADYEAARDGLTTQFLIDGFDDLPKAVIRARIAKGWTQKELADALGVAEQQVQRDESGGYSRGGVARLADVIDALGYELRGILRPASEAPLDFTPIIKITVVHDQATWASVQSVGTVQLPARRDDGFATSFVEEAGQTSGTTRRVLSRSGRS